MSRTATLARIEQLTQALNWPADKQSLWLKKHGCDSWDTAPDTVLAEALEYMEHFGKMFGTALDGVSGKCNTKGSIDSDSVRRDLRIYTGDDHEVVDDNAD